MAWVFIVCVPTYLFIIILCGFTGRNPDMPTALDFYNAISRRIRRRFYQNTERLSVLETASARQFTRQSQIGQRVEQTIQEAQERSEQYTRDYVANNELVARLSRACRYYSLQTQSKNPALREAATKRLTELVSQLQQAESRCRMLTITATGPPPEFTLPPQEGIDFFFSLGRGQLSIRPYNESPQQPVHNQKEQAIKIQRTIRGKDFSNYQSEPEDEE